jgi:acetylornithine deacetylase/succinyl-diaminopimelate desuccinylase-like protein
MMTEIERIDQFLDSNLDQSISELTRLCAQPSISAQKVGLVECGYLVAEMLEKRGFRVEIIPTPGAPVVIAEREGKSSKTLLFYNHYDVQPPEPLELWDTPPFQPTLKDGVLYGRGVSDDKGHFVYRLFAIDALLDCDGELPCHVKFILEGEEETGSPNLAKFMAENHSRLKADACIWEFGGVDYREVPQQQLGLRGIFYVELSVITANQDVHSGLGGSIFPNAAWRLVWALNSLKGVEERIRIPGFYDDVKPPSQRDIELMAALPDEADKFKTHYHLKGFIKGITGGTELRIAEVFEPTCTICGLSSGYQGPGSKTILPAVASAKVDFRLVPDMKPEKVQKQLRAHLDAEGFSDIQITPRSGSPAARTDPDHPFVKLVSDSAKEVYGADMEIIPMVGGSGPNYLFIEYLNLPVISIGVGHPGAQIHSPNENLRLDLYLKGAKHLVRLMKAFSEQD